MPEPLAPALGQAGGRVAPEAARDARDPWPAAALIVAYLGFSALMALVLRAGPSDLDVFFWPSAQVAAHGHPFLVYTVRAGAYPDANGPLSLLPLSLVAALANLVGWEGEPARSALTLGLMGVFSLLMAREAVLLVEEGRGCRLERRVLFYAAFALAPALFIAVAASGHIEQPIELWLTLLAARLVLRGRHVLAGCLLGLVLLTRSAAVVAVAALALATLAGAGVGGAPGRPAALPASGGSPGRRAAPVGGASSVSTTAGSRWAPGATLLMLIAAAVVAALGLLPFVLADRHDTLFSLLTFRGALAVGGGTWWALLARGLPWQGLVQNWDTALFLAVATVLAGVMLWRRRDRRLTPARLAALLTVATACVPMLAKTSWGYYALDPYVFATVWWLARPGHVWNRRMVPPLLLTADSVLLATKQVVPLPPSQVAEGFIASLLMVGVVVMVMRDWFSEGAEGRPEPPGGGVSADRFRTDVSRT